MSLEIPGPDQPELTTMRLQVEGDVATLTLDRPDELNAMSPDMIAELATLAPWLADRAEFRSLVITGSGRAFSAGGDVTWFRKGLDDPAADLVASVRRGADVLHQAIVDFKRIPFPVVAAVNGPAAGGGFALALAADVRLAAPEASFHASFIRIGLSCCDAGVSYLLPRVIGLGLASELMLTGGTVDAAEAERIGLVNRAVPDDQLMTVAREWAGEIAANAPLAVRAMKRLFRHGLTDDFASHTHHVLLQTLQMFGSKDFEEGMRSFVEGRPPDFRGR